MRIFILLFLTLSLNAFSQNIDPRTICSSNSVCIVPNLDLKLKSGGPRDYVIPVVFHVFNSSNPEGKLNLAQAQEAIDLLNDNFKGHHANIYNVQSSFVSLVADVGIKFVLAKKTPQGDYFNGITYHYNSYKGDNPGANVTIKQAVNWNTGNNIEGVQRYLQIWLTDNVNSDDWGSGWCYLPNYDKGGKWAGPIYNYKFIANSNPNNNDILTHEIGHYFGLSHVFGSSYDSCGDDGIDDTPITKCFSWDCKKGDLCNDGLVNVENFMGYSGCTSMFTLGQKELILYWLNDKARRNLWSEENLKFTGIIADGETPLSVADIVIEKIKIYPNPSIDGFFNISGLKGSKYKIYDSLGCLILEGSKEQFYINKKGVYVIRFYGKNVHKEIKIILK